MDIGFDGDNMNLWCIPDLETDIAADSFSPFRSLPDVNAPGKLSSSILQEQEILMNMSMYVDYYDQLYGIKYE